MLFAFFCCVLWFSIAAHAFPAIISSCHDGDSCTAEANGQTIKIRLHGIDAPEMAVPGKWPDQPYAWQAHTDIVHWIVGQKVEVTPAGTESYHRMVADISWQDTDIALALVEHGDAWVDERYTRDEALMDAEQRARDARLGLWANPVLLPPWEWRRMDWRPRR